MSRRLPRESLAVCVDKPGDRKENALPRWILFYATPNRRAIVRLIGAAGLAVALGFGLALGPTRSGERFSLGLAVSINDGPVARVIDALSSFGADSLRTDAPWRRIETSPGQYKIPKALDELVDGALARNIQSLLIFAYGHPYYGEGKPRRAEAIAAFSSDAAVVVRRFRGRVQPYDSWPEWHTYAGRTLPGSADDDVRFTSAMRTAAMATEPAFTLIPGGIADLGLGNGWFEFFASLGGHQQGDGISNHPYKWNSDSCTRANTSAPCWK